MQSYQVYTQMNPQKVEIIEAKYTMAEIVDLAWEKSSHVDLDLNQEPSHGIDADE